MAVLDWQRSGTGTGSFEVAFVSTSRGREPGPKASTQPDGVVDWVLLRVAGDPDGRVLVYDRTEWMCFLDGAGRGEFDLSPELTRALLARR